MHEAIEQRLIDVQGEVRRAFGWMMEDDSRSASDMIELVDDLASSVPFWSEEGRMDCFEGIGRRLREAGLVTILGAAATPEEALALTEEDGVIIAADGSVGALDSFQQLVCVVSDFDGGQYLESAAKEGVPIVAHGHGDNGRRAKKALTTWAKFESPPQLILSHQTTLVHPGAHNFGGFTDGDRAVCFALAMGVKKENIALVGFSLNAVGRWSATTVPEQKLKKLGWMYRILEMLGLHGAILS
ncbi:MAG: hypothetical protein QF633_03635 [Candidatus Poseidoniaceae archaeon]|nr:hypothetical protein [Candidatus Poseidoniaceae archaeon]